MSDAKPAPKRGKKQPDWAALATAPASAPKVEPEIEQSTSVVVTPNSNLVRPKLKAGTYRLPLDAHAIINEIVEEAAANGDRLSKDAVVTNALRELGKARARRKK
ncbi:hypothetical protein [Microbacterium sp.]|uniref:hypothetical protein n=1 Tax=Microbacterium sp. TaxID=51671 RepID=UPI003F9A0BA4